MRYIIDQITDGLAQLEPDDLDAQWLQIEQKLLPEGACEGVIIQYIDNQFVIDSKSIQQRQQRIKNKLSCLRTK